MLRAKARAGSRVGLLSALLIAASLLSANSFAAINADGSQATDNLNSNGFGLAGGLGELFLSVVARFGDSSNDVTYVRDLGITTGELVADLRAPGGGTLVGFEQSFAVDPTFDTFLAAAAGADSIAFNVTGKHAPALLSPSFRPADRGFFTTSPIGISVPFPVNFDAYNTPTGLFNNHVVDINSSLTGAATPTDITDSAFAENLSGVIESGDPGFHSPAFGQLFGFVSEGDAGTALALGGMVDLIFMSLSNDSNSANTPWLVGQFSLDDTGQLSFQSVPVPGALWLLGGAFIGLVGWGRGRTRER